MVCLPGRSAFSTIGSATMLENTGGARAGEFFGAQLGFVVGRPYVKRERLISHHLCVTFDL